MYRRPHVICVAALVCQSGPALAIREPGSACGIRVGAEPVPAAPGPLERREWMAVERTQRRKRRVRNSIDMMILTRRGWLKHDEVQVGDQTVGYNETTGRSEWTPVTAVVHLGVHQV